MHVDDYGLLPTSELFLPIIDARMKEKHYGLAVATLHKLRNRGAAISMPVNGSTIMQCSQRGSIIDNCTRTTKA